MEHTFACPGAMILDGSFVGLGAARSLARRGVKVCVLGEAKCVARYSRSVSRFIKLPSILKEDELAGFLVKAADVPGMGGSVLFPVSDTQVRIVAQHRSLLEKHYVLTTPPWETVRYLYDKRLTYTLARKVGIPIPRSYFPGNAERLAALDVGFPVVIKPAIAPHFWRSTEKKAYRADCERELQARYEEMSQVIGSSEVIVQELLPDPSRNLFSFAGYFRRGEPIVGLSAKRVRQFPSDFGIHSTFVESADVPQLKELAGKLLQAIDYTGLAEVEFMWDEKHSCFKLLEVNARLWAWHSLASAAGLDLPYVAFADALGRNPPIGTVRQGTKWIKGLADLRVALNSIRAGTLSIRQYLSSLRGLTAFALFSTSDPLPFIAGLFLAIHRSLRNLASKTGLASRAKNKTAGSEEKREKRAR